MKAAGQLAHCLLLSAARTWRIPVTQLSSVSRAAEFVDCCEITSASAEFIIYTELMIH